MSMQKLVMGSVIGAVVLFALGYVIFDILFLDYYVANAGAAAAGLRESQIYWAIILGSVGYGALVTYAVGKQSGPATLAGGLKGGALVGFLVWVMADFTIYGYLDLWNITVTVLDIVLETVRAAITGAVIALVLPKLPG